MLLCAYAADANFKLMHILSYVTIAQSLARALYVILFDLKPLNEDSNCTGTCVFTVRMHKKEPQKSPEHTCEIVKFPGGVYPHTPLAQSIL